MTLLYECVKMCAVCIGCRRHLKFPDFGSHFVSFFYFLFFFGGQAGFY